MAVYWFLLLALQTDKQLPSMPGFEGVGGGFEMPELKVGREVFAVFFFAAAEGRLGHWSKISVEQQPHECAARAQ